MNGKVSQRLGPQNSSVLDEKYPQEETAKVWGDLVEAVIIPNNRSIRDIVQTKSHLMHLDDAVEPYLELCLHIAAYEIFRKISFEAYNEFRFPSGIVEHVGLYRKAVIDELQELVASDS
jgi:hypothetical protein